ncbi:MAG: hypothetical protein Q9M91_04715 [Candidatus Dojkabacteria bacterium]|nr:hypothetical protein [Candidatus Dojkabacteria bacterium]
MKEINSNGYTNIEIEEIGDMLILIDANSIDVYSSDFTLGKSISIDQFTSNLTNKDFYYYYDKEANKIIMNFSELDKDIVIDLSTDSAI